MIAVERRPRDALTVTVESPPGPLGCPDCGVLAIGHGRTPVPLVDAPAMGRPVRLLWRKRRWRCPEPACPVVTFLEQNETVAAPRSKLTTRASWWAIEQIRREHASVNGIRRQLGTGWRTVWESIRPLLEPAEADPARFDDVTVLGVDEHIWHHVSTKPIDAGGRRPKELTGMVDLTRDVHGRTRKGDPLYGIRNLLRAGEEHLTERQRARLERAWAADERHVAVEVAWACAQQLRACYHQASHREGRALAERVLDSLPTCPIPEVARLGRTLRTWRSEFLGYFDTGGANNGGTEAINGLIELHRRIARGFRNRDNYRLRMLLIGGGLFA